MNLNAMEVPDEDGGDGFANNSTQSGDTFVYFRDLEENLIKRIAEADAVFGAVAWLSNYAILDALAEVETACIVVQKEDFLRPDKDSKSNFRKTLQRKYDALTISKDVARYSLEGTIGPQLSYCSDPSLEPVRCAGNHNSTKNPSHPRMHNKFMVFCDVVNGEDEDSYDIVKPYAVWTGSFNFSYAASMSLENAVVMTDKEIVMAYFKEFAQIYAISEPLDWTSEWCAPEFRIGS
jgi:hypothetical protein